MSTPFTQWSHGRLRAGSLDRRLAPHSPLEPARPGRYRSWARGLAFRRPFLALPARMLDDRVRAGEHQGGVTVVESYQVGRLPARSADLDNLTRPPRMAHDIGVHVEPVPDGCLHAPTSSSAFAPACPHSPRCPRGAGHAHGVPRLAQAGIHLDATGWHRPCAAFTSGSLAQLAHPAPRRTAPCWPGRGRARPRSSSALNSAPNSSLADRLLLPLNRA